MSLELNSHHVEIPGSGLNVHYLSTANLQDQSRPAVFFHHGAGFTSSTFIPLVNELKKRLSAKPNATRVSLIIPDIRNHGTTRTLSPSNKIDLRIELLDEDFIRFISLIYPEAPKAPDLYLVGHSMGGAPATRVIPTLLSRGYRIRGLAVLDTVETTLDHIPELIEGFKRWPSGFIDVQAAIDWHIASRVINNRSSANITVPPILQPSDDTDLPLAWRTPILSTTDFWQGWFSGMSSSFLKAPCPKILVLAHRTGLPKLLHDTLEADPVAFKFIRMGDGVGHFVHEDDPEGVAKILDELFSAT